MKVFIITETLLAGGAEWFVLRLCEGLRKRGHNVILFILRPDLVDKRLTQRYPDIDQKHQPAWKIQAASIIDRVLRKLGFRSNITAGLNTRLLEQQIEHLKPDVIHSHLLNADLVVIDANRTSNVRHITTIHGDYIQAIKNDNKDIQLEIQKAVSRLDRIAVISDEQTSMLYDHIPSIKPKLLKVYNGYSKPDNIIDRAGGQTFNFGLIARAIPEKGWEVAIKAFLQIKDDNARLYLYGEGEFLEHLRKKHSDSRIIFPGFSNDPLAVVSNLSVGLLPTYYDAESLPTTVIEYLAMSKPVIATAVGEIPRMLETENHDLAGILIETIDPEEMVEPLYQAMRNLMLNAALYQRLSDNCSSAFKKFSMDKCIDSYLSLYKAKVPEKCVA